MKRLLVLAAVAAALAVIPGCGEPDGRVADMAQQVTHEQAQQNRRMAEGSKAVAEGSKQLVEHDAKARREIVRLQQDLRKDQAEIGKQRDQLERSDRPLPASGSRNPGPEPCVSGLPSSWSAWRRWSWPACRSSASGSLRLAKKSGSSG